MGCFGLALRQEVNPTEGLYQVQSERPEDSETVVQDPALQTQRFKPSASKEAYEHNHASERQQ